MLYSPTGHPIDVVYRRAVTTDVMEHYHEVGDFLAAVKNRDICLIGSFCTQIIHNKWLFQVLYREETAAFLTEEERQFVRKTRAENGTSAAGGGDDRGGGGKPRRPILSNRWIPMRPGAFMPESIFRGEEWEKLVKEHAGEDYIYQEYCPPYRTENIYLGGGEKPRWKNYTTCPAFLCTTGNFPGFIPACPTRNYFFPVQ